MIAIIFAVKLLPKPPVLISKEDIFTSIKHGFSYVHNNKNLLGVISLDLFAVLFGGAVAFVPEVAEKILQAGPIGYGFLNAAMDLGSLVSIIILLKFPMKKKQGLKMMMAVAGFGICIIVFGLAKAYWLSFLALLIAGFFDGISVVVRGTIAQLNTPDELRGRVAAINMIFVNSSNELGQFESGITSKYMGTIPAIIFGGVMSIGVVVTSWFAFPNLKKIKY
jgi:MFS family permease